MAYDYDRPDPTLRGAVIRLARENPDGIRRHLVPLLRQVQGGRFADQALIKLIKETFPEVQYPEEFAQDFDDEFSDALSGRARNLIKQIEESEKPRRFKMEGSGWESDSYNLGDERSGDEWVSVEVDFAAEVSWTVLGNIGLDKVQADVVRTLARRNRIDPKALTALFKGRVIRSMVEGIWQQIVDDLDSDGPKNEILYGTRTPKGVVKAMINAWEANLDDKVSWDEDAPWVEMPIDYSVESKWRWTRTVVPTSKGFDASWVARPDVDIAWPGDRRLRY